MTDAAIISACQTYRYMLSRQLVPVRPVFPKRIVFLMLNPSTADASKDDPTIRRCKSFGQREGADELIVINLYALRSTDPLGLWEHDDPVGPDNDMAILANARLTNSVVCAWGTHAREDRVRHVHALLMQAGIVMQCLGYSKEGHPRHPLMLPGDARLQPYPPLR